MFRTLILAAVLSVFCVSNANADLSRIAIGAWSKHVPSSDTVTNETHNLIGIEYNSIGVGYFKNSYGRDTVYIGKIWRTATGENISLVASLGVNYGYRACAQPDPGTGGSKLCPHGYIGIEYTEYRVVPTLKFMPGAFIFSPEIKF